MTEDDPGLRLEESMGIGMDGASQYYERLLSGHGDLLGEQADDIA
jgi:hypothetical protein